MDSKKVSNLESAVKGSPVSRRWLLKNTANLTAGTVAVSALGLRASALQAECIGPVAEVEPHCDLSTGEIFDRERHHRWDSF